MSSEHFTDEDRATVEALAWAMSYLPPGWGVINTKTHVAVPVEAHAAADPVDTTEFERMLNAFETFSVSAALAYADDRKPLNEQRFVVKQRLIDLYREASR